jgi:subtilisin family serine protease
LLGVAPKVKLLAVRVFNGDKESALSTTFNIIKGLDWPAGNAGPRSPPLFPAADPYVIGVTATDADDGLLPEANRGPQVAVAAPGVEVLVPAPDASYQITTGTSVAAAHASGVAALLLARNPKLTPDQVRRALVGTAHHIAGKRDEVGAGVIDALGVVNSLPH